MAETTGVDELQGLGDLEAEVLDKVAKVAVVSEYVHGVEAAEREDHDKVAAIGAIEPKVLERGSDVEVVFEY